jgi:uncharacterized membrane protein YqjE
MEQKDPNPSGIAGAIRRLSRTLVGAVQTRLELFALELQEEKHRLVTLLIWTAAVLFFAILAVICLNIAIVLACPEGARPYVLVGFGLVYGILSWRGVLALKRQWQDRPAPWSGTVGELKKDAEWIRSRI